MDDRSFLRVIPSVPNNTILPARLRRSLASGTNKALTLIVGMGGYGKTTLVSSYVSDFENCGQREVAWLNVTPLDNGVSGFWSQVAKALFGDEAASSPIGEDLYDSLATLDYTDGLSWVDVLLSIAAETRIQYCLVIDDIHFIENEQILLALNHLIQHPASPINFILIGRANPGISLHKLRMADRIVEIGPDDLSFTEADMLEFFNARLKHRLSRENLGKIAEITRGWVAGLQMIALVLDKNPDAQNLIDGFSKNNRWLMDFLTEEVLNTMDERTKSFLLHTCFLPSATQETYEVLLGSINCRKMIEDLLDMNLLIKTTVIVDNTDEAWYSYHPLFSESLKHCMQMAYSKHEIRHMQEIASAWFESAGYFDQAIKIAIEAGNYEEVLRMITDHLYSVMKNVDSGVLLNWLENLPHPEQSNDYLFALINAWANFIAGKTKRSRMWLETARCSIQELDDHTLERTNSIFEAVEVGTSVFAGEYKRALDLGQESLQNLGGPQLFLRGTIMHNMGEALERLGCYEEAYESFIRAKASADKGGRLVISLLCSCEIGWIEFIRGNLDGASNAYLKAVTSYKEIESQENWAIGLLYVGLARLYLFWGDTKKCALYIDLAHASLNPHTNKDGYLEAQTIIAELQMFIGNFEDARDTMLMAHELLEIDHTPRGVDLLVPIILAQALVCNEHYERASEILEEVSERINRDDTYYQVLWKITKANVLMKLGDAKRASYLLKYAIFQAKDEGLISLSIAARVMVTTTLMELDAKDDALGFLVEALAEAAPEGIVLPFIEKLDVIKPLLFNLVYGHGENKVFAQKNSDVKEFALKLLGLHQENGTLRINSLSGSEKADLLSQRELQVYELLKLGKTRKEISDTLGIRLNTVRTHIRNIYQKTDIHDRSLL